MPFPPTPDHVWDITQPPDTQAANLLGQDIRFLKDDIMQRLSLLSGTLANRPTPETINATWGGVNFGLLYFSTDTSQIFQWNGGAWVDVTSSFLPSNKATVLFKDNTSHVHTGTVTEDTIYTVPINAGSLGNSGVLRGSFSYTQTIGTTAIFFIRLGGVQIISTSIGNTVDNHIDFTIGNRAATNSQVNEVINLASGSVVGANITTTAIDTTVLQNLTISIQSSLAGNSQTLNRFLLEQL